MEPPKPNQPFDPEFEAMKARLFYNDPNKRLSIAYANDELAILLDRFDWYHSSIINGNTITVYCDYLNRDVMSMIPYKLYGYDIKVAFAAYLNAAEEYGPNNKHIIWLHDGNLD